MRNGRMGFLRQVFEQLLSSRSLLVAETLKEEEEMRGPPLGPVIGRYPSSSDGNSQMGSRIIMHNKNCRDVLFLVIFIAFWVAMIVNSSFGFNKGNPFKSCIALRLSIVEFLVKNEGYWSCKCKSSKVFSLYLTPELRNNSLQLQGPCYPVIFPSINDIKCVSTASATVNIIEDIVIDKSIHRAVNSRSAVLKRYVADVGKAWPVLLVCGGSLPLFLSLIWLLMIRHFFGAMPWITVILFGILIVSVTMFYYLKASWIGNDTISSIIGEHDPYYHVFARETSHLHAAAVLMTGVMA
ncbi:hypothetical protein ACH5RR_028058, partial [Cinchona calisaya]